MFCLCPFNHTLQITTDGRKKERRKGGRDEGRDGGREEQPKAGRKKKIEYTHPLRGQLANNYLSLTGNR